MHLFPESMDQIKGSIYSQGGKSEFVIVGDDPGGVGCYGVVSWAAAYPMWQAGGCGGAEHYGFTVNR